MKKLFILLLAFPSLASLSQQTHNGLPVIRAESANADYRVGDKWVRGNWRIMPEVSPDVLEIPTFSRRLEFGFYTDRDSIVFALDASVKKQFYVLTANQQYALTEVRGFDFAPLAFDAAARPSAYRFWYEENKNNSYLERFRSTHPLTALLSGLKTDSAKALRILNWAHRQWSHNGENQPSKNDALTILAEAAQGKQFRCVEYGIVATTALNAAGLPARVLALKTKDVETTASGAGHVLLEVYLPDLKKWVLMDGQWNAMPLLNGVPLNAVEFQQAIAANYDQLEIRSLSGADKDNYTRWIFPYLYYFDVSFDNREGSDKKESHSGKTKLMLVPAGAKEPVVFQQKSPISNVIYTRSLADFYSPPFR